MSNVAAPNTALFALLAAACFAGAHVAAKRGLRHVGPWAGTLLSLTVSALVTGLVAMRDLPEEMPLASVTWFAAAGVLAPALGRTTSISGVGALGPSVSVPIQTSLYPLLSTAVAVLVLGERVTGQRLIGVAFVVLGVWRLSRTQTTTQSQEFPDSQQARPQPQIKTRRVHRPELLLPLVAGASYGGADVLRKQGLDLLPSALFGAFVSLFTGLLVYLAIALLVPAIRRRLRPAWNVWFLLNGLLSAFALLSVFTALSNGDVSEVSPIVAAQPLFVVGLSALFLRGYEQLRAATVLGVISTVAGTVLIVLS